MRYGWFASVVLLAHVGGCEPTRNQVTADATYVGRDVCRSCHVGEVQAYTGSDHDLAMDHATGETVLGDFSEVIVPDGTRETRFSTRGGRYFVSTAGPDGVTQEYRVAYTFGARPLQQYLVELEGGHIQRLPWSWDARPAAQGGQRWFHVYGDEAVEPGDVLHWTRSSQNWNRMCADCHSTNLVKGYDPRTDTYRTTWSEIDVSCEACHGPASQHVAWAEDKSSPRPRDFGFALRLTDSDTAVWLRSASERTASRTVARSDRTSTEQCARCHAHRVPIAAYEHGDRFDDAYRLSLLREPLYHADGQVREEVFVYGSFLQSKMYRAGVDCGDCHDPHSLQLRAEGNALCTQCHNPTVFDREEHTQHPTASEGSECVSCHMPQTTFMQVDARREHSFKVPSAALNDGPNACAGCHVTEDIGWVRAALADQFGVTGDSKSDQTSLTLHAAFRVEPSGLDNLLHLTTDTAVAPLVRATAVSYLDRYPTPEAVEAATTATHDPHPSVRAAGALALGFLPPADRRPIVEPLLEDSTRVVRIAAARSLAALSLGTPEGDEPTPIAQATEEYRASLAINADDPAANVELGDYHRERGQLVEATTAYQRALELESGLAAAYVNLADLYRGSNREADARAILLEGRERSAPTALLEYSVGLMEVRAGDLEVATEAFVEAVRLAPEDARFVLALGLALRAHGQPAAAVDALASALPGLSEKQQVGALLIDLYRELGRSDDAMRLAQQMSVAGPVDTASATIQTRN